jgi:predicted DsbA family dithiol-disulfide isomerase
MPCDPRLWTEAPISGTFPACVAVEAASEQGWEAGYRYLRRIREGLLCFRRKLDEPAALVAEAGPAGLDLAAFEAALDSTAPASSTATCSASSAPSTTGRCPAPSSRPGT